MQNNEKFLPIPGYEGYYEISNFGRILSLSKIIPCSSGKTRILKERILPNKPHILGYVKRILSKDTISSEFKVHRLVWATFNGSIPEGKEINHINGVKHDNRLENLELVTKKQNIQHAIKLGLMNTRGESSPNSKLTKQQVLQIRMNKKNGDTLSKISKEFNIHPAYASLIISGKRWGWLT